MSEPRSKNYRVNPDFVPREPTGADMFSYCTLDEYSPAEFERIAKWMTEAGAQSFRITRIEEGDTSPYPSGYWFEGWRDKLANQLPFGAARPDDGTVSPPLTSHP